MINTVIQHYQAFSFALGGLFGAALVFIAYFGLIS
jgi:hypothetical protein